VGDVGPFRRRVQRLDIPAADTIFVSFSGEITDRSVQALTRAMTQCADSDAEDVCLLFTTPGGTVSEGIYLYNMLRAYPFRLAIHNVGDVDSIGTAIFLASDVRYACSTSKFMLHGVSRGFARPGPELSLTAEEPGGPWSTSPRTKSGSVRSSSSGRS